MLIYGNQLTKDKFFFLGGGGLSILMIEMNTYETIPKFSVEAPPSPRFGHLIDNPQLLIPLQIWMVTP